MKTLQEFHQFAQKHHESLQKQALAPVVRWKYGSGPLDSFEPWSFELGDLNRNFKKSVTAARFAELKKSGFR